MVWRMRLRRRARTEAREAEAARPVIGAPAERPAPDTPGEGESTYARGERAPAAGERRARREGVEAAPSRRPRGAAGRTREAGAATAGAVGSGVLLLARLVMLAAALIALLIGAAIVLTLVDANASNTIVKGIHEGANFFAGAFTGLITFSGHPKRELTVDWGIALVVYLLVGALLARLIASVGYSGLRFERRHRAVPTH